MGVGAFFLNKLIKRDGRERESSGESQVSPLFSSPIHRARVLDANPRDAVVEANEVLEVASTYGKDLSVCKRHRRAAVLASGCRYLFGGGSSTLRRGVVAVRLRGGAVRASPPLMKDPR